MSATPKPPTLEQLRSQLSRLDNQIEGSPTLSQRQRYQALNAQIQGFPGASLGGQGRILPRNGTHTISGTPRF